MKLIELHIKSKANGLNHEMVYGAVSPFSIYGFLNFVMNYDILLDGDKLDYDDFVKEKFFYVIRKAQLLKSSNNNLMQKRSVIRTENTNTIFDTPIVYTDISIFVETDMSSNDLDNFVKDAPEIKNKARFMGFFMDYFNIRYYEYNKERDKDYNSFLKRIFRQRKGRLVFRENIQSNNAEILNEIINKTALKNENNTKIFPTTTGYRMFGEEKDFNLPFKHRFAEPLIGLVNVKSVFGLKDFEDKYFQIQEQNNCVFV